MRNMSQIHQWAESDRVREFLKEKFGIEHVPCYYWLLSLLKLVKPESLNKCLMKWAESILPEERKGLTIALDGKTVRSTGKMGAYDSPLHIISAQLSELGITFASKSVEGKSNEIPAVQQLIGELDIQGYSSHMYNKGVSEIRSCSAQSLPSRQAAGLSVLLQGKYTVD